MQLVYFIQLLFALFAEEKILFYATLYFGTPYVYNESTTYTKMFSALRRWDNDRHGYKKADKQFA